MPECHVFPGSCVPSHFFLDFSLAAVKRKDPGVLSLWGAWDPEVDGSVLTNCCQHLLLVVPRRRWLGDFVPGGTSSGQQNDRRGLCVRMVGDRPVPRSRTHRVSHQRLRQGGRHLADVQILPPRGYVTGGVLCAEPEVNVTGAHPVKPELSVEWLGPSRAPGAASAPLRGGCVRCTAAQLCARGPAAPPSPSVTLKPASGLRSGTLEGLICLLFVARWVASEKSFNASLFWFRRLCGTQSPHGVASRCRLTVSPHYLWRTMPFRCLIFYLKTETIRRGSSLAGWSCEPWVTVYLLNYGRNYNHRRLYLKKRKFLPF